MQPVKNESLEIYNRTGQVELRTEAVSCCINGCGKGLGLPANSGGTIVSLLSSVREKKKPVLFIYFYFLKKFFHETFLQSQMKDWVT